MGATPIPFLIFCGVIALAIYGLVKLLQENQQPSKSPAQLDQEAEWYRAEKRRVEALAELELKEAELRETRHFLENHNR